MDGPGEKLDDEEQMAVNNEKLERKGDNQRVILFFCRWSKIYDMPYRKFLSET